MKINWNPFKRRKPINRNSKRNINTRSIDDLQTESLLAKWKSSAKPFPSFTSTNQFKLVGRAREICLNNSYGKAALRILKHNVVGENGVNFQSHVKLPNNELDVPVNAAIEEAWRDFNKANMLDTAGQSNLKEIQLTAITSLITDGEFFIRMVYSDDFEYGLKIQEIDPLRIPPKNTYEYRDTDPGKEGVVLKNGIKFDKVSGAPVSYLLNEEHPTTYHMDVKRESDIPAAHMLHGFIRERVGQIRGVPLGQTAAPTLYMGAKYSEAALTNARVGASKIGWIEQQQSMSEPSAYQVDEHGNYVLDDEGNQIPV